MAQRILFIFYLLTLAVSGFSQNGLIHTHFDKTNIPPVPNYSKEATWAALPFKKDLADSTPIGLYDNQTNADVDVFFIYPTSYTNKPKDRYTWNADVNNATLNQKTSRTSILYQASIFNASCRVYAPYYRQAHYSVFLTNDSNDRKQALNLAYEDVKAAFEFYLKNYNNNRPIIIASHSQGTVHAVRLLQEFFINQPLQKKLVVAYILGMPVSAKMLPTILPCKDSLQTNCFNCWNTFENKYVPKFYSLGLNQAICTNPLSWKLDENYVDASYNKGAIIRPFSKIRPNCCDAKVNQGLLWVKKPNFPGSFFIRTHIYHAGDFNFYYLDIRENVATRIRVYLNKNVN